MNANLLLIRKAAAAGGLPVEKLRITLRQPLTYQSSQLYDLHLPDRHLLAKHFVRPDEIPEAPRREFRALKRLSELDIAPQPVCYEPEAAPVVIYEYLDGEMWDRRRPAAQELAQLAALWSLVHSLPADGLGPSRIAQMSILDRGSTFRQHFGAYARWVEREFPAGKEAAALCLSLVERYQRLATVLSAFPPRLCFCHPDGRFANVIGRPDGRLGLVDWEDSGYGDPATDIADLITHANQEDLLDHTAWQTFLEPYLAARIQDDPTLHKRIELYLGLYPVFWLAVLLALHTPDGSSAPADTRMINGLPVNERLRRYLARAHAWPDMDFSGWLDVLRDLVFFPPAVPLQTTSAD